MFVFVTTINNKNIDLETMEKTIGILGGMGPEASCLLYKRIIEYTNASKDQDHIPIIIYNNPKTPDRTRHIIHGEESPVPYLIKGINLLNDSGVDCILVACNTSHYYFDSFKTHTQQYIMNMVELTAEHIKSTCSQFDHIGILGTTGTINTFLYQNALVGIGFKPICLDDIKQEGLVMEAIYGKKGIKAGFVNEPRKTLNKAARTLNEAGATAVILGCTEISMVLNQNDFGFKLIDPLTILAKKAIVHCGYSLRLKNNN